MKNVFVRLSILVAAIMLYASCEKETFVGAEDLPQKGIAFLSDNFQGAKANHVKKEDEGLGGVEYTVYLDNGITVKFDKNGNWEEVNAPDGQTIPTGFIPSKIVSYVRDHYPNEGINSIDKENNRYD